MTHHETVQPTSYKREIRRLAPPQAGRASSSLNKADDKKPDSRVHDLREHQMPAAGFR